MCLGKMLKKEWEREEEENGEAFKKVKEYIKELEREERDEQRRA